MAGAGWIDCCQAQMKVVQINKFWYENKNGSICFFI